ncbi:MAG: T3SS effector HopA1 family protein [bacterium]
MENMERGKEHPNNQQPFVNRDNLNCKEASGEEPTSQQEFKLSGAEMEIKDAGTPIEDLNSTNGTVVKLKNLEQLNEEQIEVQGNGSESERALVKFREFVQKHQSEIEKALEQGNLKNFFYQKFYSTDIDNSKYRTDNLKALLKVLLLAIKYRGQVKNARKELLQEGIVPNDNNYWLFVNTNGGYYYQSGLGRFYFNLKPEHVAKIFSETARAFQRAGLHSQMKIPMVGNVMVFNRLDKMVIYFDAEEEQKALQIIEDIYSNNSEAFDETGIPRFTAEVKNQRGEKMAGIGFGEEPLFENESFGSIRAEILAEVYFVARNSHHSISDLEAAFVKACLNYQIDPKNPAFNLSNGPEKFPELRRRINAQT